MAASRPHRPDATRVLELYCGIGGCAVALGGRAQVSAALDISQAALAVYRANLPHRVAARTLESLRPSDPSLADADLWWLSPPCQPYTRRGLGRDLDDPRSRSLVHLVGLMARVRPPMMALENVPEMAGSRAHQLLRESLGGAGYQLAERILCPSELGVPNRRRRFYLVASRSGLTGWALPHRTAPPPLLDPGAPSSSAPPADAPESRRPRVPRSPPLAAFLDPEDSAELAVEPALLRRYAHAIDLVDADDPTAVTATFTAAYGRSPVRAGSYLRRGATVRRFHPREILRLLGFPSSYRFPTSLPLPHQWRLVGSSLSVPAVREVLGALPPFAGGAP